MGARGVKLRAYQQEAIDALWTYFSKYTGNPLIVVPTGGGKSHIQAAWIERCLDAFPETRFLCLTHVKELVEQNAAKLDARLGPLKVGVYSAGLRRRELGRPVTVASVQSVLKRPGALERIDMVIIDECHRVPTKGHGQYRQLLDDLRTMNPALKVIGLSATPYRMGSGWLHEGDDAIFSDIAYEVPILQLIGDGYLSPLRSKSGVSEADLSGVRTRAGEFVKGELEAVMDDVDLVERTLDEVEHHAADRKKWLIFCAGIQHAEHVRDARRERDISAEMVSGKTPAAERDRIVRDFKAGKFRALTNVGVLTTGFDAPDVDCVIMLRPTKSPGLYAQIIGRGLRIAPGKEDCLILDFAGNVRRHGPVDQIKVRNKRGKGGGVAPMKVCPECRNVTHASARECGECGFAFPIEEAPVHEAKADEAPVLSTEKREPELDIHAVDEVSYRSHPGRDGKPPTFRVTYRCGLQTFTEFVPIEHARGSYFGRKWWRARSSEEPPKTVMEAIRRQGELMVPEELEVDHQPRYPRVIRALGLHRIAVRSARRPCEAAAADRLFGCEVTHQE